MGEISLHGDCLVNRATEFQQVLLHHLNSAEGRVEIDLAGTGRCDLSFFQLICAATRSFGKKKKSLLLRNALPASFLKQFKKSGFAPVCKKCAFDECILKEAIGPA